jgi:formylglycine-generating enzyme required for sulfatase activity
MAGSAVQARGKVEKMIIAPGKGDVKMQKIVPLLAISICLGFTLGAASAEVFTNSVGMKMIRIEFGTFEMGNPNAKADSWDERPVHKVTISQPFYISETEVTIEQFQEFRRDYTGSLTTEPYMTGLSWHDAMAFCEWLSKKEGKPYRLPTEAEWEYTARAGTDTAFWSGETPPEPGKANPWGLQNVHTGPAEWCYDWYGPYRCEAQVDPVGADAGMTRVIRGGGLDSQDAYYARCHNRASHAPAFTIMTGTEPVRESKKKEFSNSPDLEGLIGLWYGQTTFEKPKGVDHIVTLDMDWGSFQQPGEDRSSRWSARWEGVLVAPTTGTVTFHVGSDHAAHLTVDGKTIVEWEGDQAERSGSIALEKGIKYPIGVSYVHNRGDQKFLKVEWSWEGKERTPIPRDSLWHSEAQHEMQKNKGPKEILPGHHGIGFRVVQGPRPEGKPYRSCQPFIQECIVQNQSQLMQGPDPDEPWFRRRDLLPIPPDNVPQQESIAAGLFPGFMPHIHNPGLVVCPNGDVTAVFFTAVTGPHGEDKPDVSLVATRLRFGSNRWDMPESFIDFADLNDTSSCLWREGRRIYCFWGHTFYNYAYPFQWTSSDDNGATWSQVSFPQFVGQIGPPTNQPINSVIRADDGTLYLPSDGLGSTSVVWVTKDDLKTWYDPGGRTFGRHATCALLRDGRILAMGGKHTNIEGYMPKSISSDGGKTWEIEKTPFCELGSQQRPTLLRLASGRLFFSGDFQYRDGRHPDQIKRRGVYVALSDDEGKTWHIKKLAGTRQYDGTFAYINKGNPHHTIGYAVACQAPNGIIHLIGTMNHPNQHWELNEAWILDAEAGYVEPENPQITGVKQSGERYPSGKIKATWAGDITREGEYRLHGEQVWYYENGNKQWQVTYEAGKKVGEEIFWDQQGKRIWTWDHNDDGTDLWTQYHPNGNMKAQSTWRNLRAHWEAKRWDYNGELISHHQFYNGRLQGAYLR